MGIPELILGIIEQVLKLGVLGAQEVHKYEDNRLRLQKRFYAEYSKPIDLRSHVELDDIEFRLCQLGEAITAALRTKNAGN